MICIHGYRAAVLAAALLAFGSMLHATPAGQYRLLLRPDMVTSSSPVADFSGIVDEQAEIGDPPASAPATGWKINSSHNKEFPFSAVIDLGRETPLATLWFYDMNSKGDVLIEAGRPGAWTRVATYDCARYQSWAAVPLEVKTRYLRLTLQSPGAIFNEIALDAYSEAGYQAVQNRETERQAALQQAHAEALKRPITEIEPFGRLSVVDEVACADADAGHGFADSPVGASRVETLLGSPCRVLRPVANESSYITYRIGQHKLLRAGAAYVLAVEYPEDAPRSMVVVNTGDETSRGFHTGSTVGDALHPKYVNNFCESLDMPLSGRYETWTLLLRLHNHFPERGLPRGGGTRAQKPEDGFDVTVCQFSAPNDPTSAGLAVRRIRLYEVVDPDKLVQPVHLPPAELPHRRLCWREEMADGVLGGSKKGEDSGLDDPLDWYRHKADLMRFLGMNTYTKDLLEFGACQHWDSSPYGGNKWVYFNAAQAPLWGRIVALMGSYGFEVLPYYEYSGSKGQEGLGNERRAKPLTRDDAFTHIKWVEASNADLTDPDTYADFKKMLDLTVVRLADKAHFAGIWIRPRSQLPVGFGDATRKRFATEANGGQAVTRAQLQSDKALYGRYLDWWGLKRRDFLVAMRDYLRANGVPKACVLFTGCPSEPGAGFADFTPRFVTDHPERWRATFALPADAAPDAKPTTLLTPAEVASRDLYLDGLLAPGLNWGNWEWQHAHPADDPHHYIQTDGVLLTHAINRLYTVNSPKTFDTYRTVSGLAVVRHDSLNENMMFDAADKPKLGYFIADMERAGPACMMAEAVAMANGDPDLIGYLVGSNFGRGFPKYVRDFNANFLALPALPSTRLAGASSDPDVVVRTIATPGHGTYVAVVNTAAVPKHGVTMALKAAGTLQTLAEGATVCVQGSTATLDLRPYQLVSMKLGPL